MFKMKALTKLDHCMILCFHPCNLTNFLLMALIMSDVKYSLVALDHVDIYRLFFRHVLKVF